MQIRWHRIAGLAFAILGFLVVGCVAMPPAQVVPLADQSAVAERPEWNVGDRWVFRWKEGLSGGTYSRVVIEESVSGYVIRHGERDRVWHYTPDLAYLMRLDDGELARLHSPPRPYFQWPLAAGMKWDSGGGVT
jgi:hypothetical protein